ncbi:hypothetical protein EV127DRAFT_223167 [Xylaria flabelliformis]|nr:hypothetical protein EV127DRAFT_223167 [Xylaria flabelliformis]
MESIHTPLIETSSSSGYISSFYGPPLLTLFSAPSDCSQNWVYDPNTPGCVWSNGLQNQPFPWSSCQPYAASAGTYSPGICPSGQEFKTVIQIIHEDESGIVDTSYSGYCCWTDFNWGVATVLYADSQGLTYSGCVASLDPPVTAWLPLQTGYFPTTTVIHTGVFVFGTYLEMQWHEYDLSSFPESLAASLRVGMGLPAFTTKSISTIPTKSSPARGSNDTDLPNSSVYLSKDAIAGIGAGVAVAVLLIGALGYLALSRRWKRPDHEVEQQDNALSNVETNKHGWLRRITRWKKDPRPDLPEMDQGQNIFKYFRGGAWLAELQGTHNRNPNDNSQVGHDHDSAAVVEDPIELEGSVPVVQETVPEAISEADHEQSRS